MAKRKGRPREISDLELAFCMAQGMTQKEIAEKMSCNVSTIAKNVKRMREENPELLEEMSTEEFRKKESDDLANMRRIILKGIRRKLTTMSLNSISLQQLGVIYGIMFEKDRLLRGEATEHIATATYNQLDDKTLAVVGDAVKKLTNEMLQESRSKVEEDPVPVSGDSESDEIVVQQTTD